jgi:hypothetical protein
MQTLIPPKPCRRVHFPKSSPSFIASTSSWPAISQNDLAFAYKITAVTNGVEAQAAAVSSPVSRFAGSGPMVTYSAHDDEIQLAM